MIIAKGGQDVKDKEAYVSYYFIMTYNGTRGAKIGPFRRGAKGPRQKAKKLVTTGTGPGSDGQTVGSGYLTGFAGKRPRSFLSRS